MDSETRAQALLEAAIETEQSSHRVQPGDDVAAIRRAVRELARTRGVHIRTGVVGDALVVIRADAQLWNESAAVMKEKLAAPD